MSYPLVRELAEDAIPVTVTCRVLQIARQPYYRWLANSVTSVELDQAYRANALFDAHRDDPEFGYRYLLDEARDAGRSMAARTAWRICSDNGWWSAFGKKRGKGKKPGPPVHDDLCAVTDDKGRIRHEFKAESANELWIGDIAIPPRSTSGCADRLGPTAADSAAATPVAKRRSPSSILPWRRSGASR